MREGGRGPRMRDDRRGMAVGGSVLGFEACFLLFFCFGGNHSDGGSESFLFKDQNFACYSDWTHLLDVYGSCWCHYSVRGWGITGDLIS